MVGFLKPLVDRGDRLAVIFVGRHECPSPVREPHALKGSGLLCSELRNDRFPGISPVPYNRGRIERDFRDVAESGPELPTLDGNPSSITLTTSRGSTVPGSISNSAGSRSASRSTLRTAAVRKPSLATPSCASMSSISCVVVAASPWT